MEWFHYQHEKLILSVIIQPGAKRTELMGLQGNALKIRLQAPPIEGRANEALIKWMAKFFKVPKSQVSIKQGFHSRQKLLVIQRSAVDPITTFLKYLDL